MNVPARRALAVLVAWVLAGPVSAQQSLRDPWVFRTVLDGEPRRLVVALHERLWVAFDTTSGTKVATWAGGSGAAEGRAAPVREQRGTRLAWDETRRFEWRSGPSTAALEAALLSCELAGDRVVLRSRVDVPGQDPLFVEETVQLGTEDDLIRVKNRFFELPEGGEEVILHRRFVAEQLPERGEVVLVLEDGGAPEHLAAIGSHAGTWTLSVPAAGRQPCGFTARLLPGNEVTWSMVHRVTDEDVAPPPPVARFPDAAPVDPPADVPGFTVDRLTVPGVPSTVTALLWLPDGTLALTTGDATGSVWMLDGLDAGTQDGVTARRFATGLLDPAGLALVDGRLLVLQREEVTELLDEDGDGVADRHRMLATGWDVSAHPDERAVGLVSHGGGYYAALSGPPPEGVAARRSDRGAVLRFDARAQSPAVVARGAAMPAGFGVVGGHLLLADALRGANGPGRLLNVRQAAPLAGRDGDSPVTWLAGARPSAPVPYPGRDDAVALLLGGSLVRVDLSPDGSRRIGEVQAVAPGLAAPGAQLALGPEGALWTAGAGPGPSDLVLQRLRPQSEAEAGGDDPGWESLFDGRTTRGWRGFRQQTVPDGWIVEDGCLVRAGPGGDIITEGRYRDFELELEWAIEPGGNSGIFFHVSEGADAVWRTGPEMQVLDNERHPDGRSELTSAGANYALHAPVRDVTRPPGEFNRVRLVVAGGRVEHWLNGVQLLAYELGSADWEARVAASKFAAMPGYGREGEGHIALQDHGDRVRYRNLRIRRLDPDR